MRNRVIYQSDALLFSSGLATSSMFDSGNSGNNLLLELSRVQTIGNDETLNRIDVFEQGQLARIDAVIVEGPTVTLSTSWYITDGSNEQKIGLVINGQNSCISGLLTKQNEPKNAFVLQVAEGFDAVGNPLGVNQNNGVISFGNMYLNSISWEARVGQLPTCTASFEGFNTKYDTGTIQLGTPAINSTNGLPITGINFTIPPITAITGVNTPSAIKPGDVEVFAPNAAAVGIWLSGNNAGTVTPCPVQSFTVTIPLNRVKLNKLGSLYPYDIEPQFPVKPTLSMEVYETDLEASALSNIICNDQFVNFFIGMKNPACGGTGSYAFTIGVSNAKLDSQREDLSISSIAKTVTLNYSCSVAAANDTVNGIFLSGQGAF